MLKFPKKSHRKYFNPPGDSVELAEIFGIIFGDGGINNDWQLVITLNSIADFEYSKYVYSLLKKLFKFDVVIRKRPNRNALVLVCSGMNLIDFLVSKGAVRGNKIKQQLNIPHWIKNNSDYKKAFLRGLVDTDGCLYVHHHCLNNKLYNNLGLCFTNFSTRLIDSAAKILQEFNIKPYVKNQSTRIYLYSQKSVLEYINTFGSSNARITKKIAEWKSVSVTYSHGEVA